MESERDLLHLGQLSPRVLVVAQILFVSHQDDGHIGAEMLHLRSPLLWDVFCGVQIIKCSYPRSVVIIDVKETLTIILFYS